MQIGIITQHYPPDFEGGAEVVVRSQARALADIGHQVRIVAGTDRPLGEGAPEVEREWVDGLSVTWLPRTPEEGYGLELERPRVLDHVLAACEGCDVAHVHHWSTLDCRLVRALAERMPVVLTLHDFFPACPRFFRLSPVEGVRCPPRGRFEDCVTCVRHEVGDMADDELETRLAERAAEYDAEIAAAHAVVVPSRLHAALIGELVDLEDEKLSVVPHGLCRDFGAAKGARRRRLYDGGKPLVVLHFGNLCAEKGTLDLVRSLAALPPGSVELVLAGRALDEGFEERLAEARGSLRVRWQAKYDSEDLARLAAESDIAAFPSYLYESYGLVVDEAMALGLPVWISDRGAARERINGWGAWGGCGRVLPAGDTPAWTSAFREVLIAPDLLEEMHDRLPLRLPAAADAAAKLSELYRSLAGARSS